MGTHPIFESDFDYLTERLKMAGSKKKPTGFTQAEQELLAGFSRSTSGKGSLVFWIHALYVVGIPIWIQARIHQYPVGDQLVYLIIGTVVQAIALQFAYKNVKFVSKEKIATARSEAIANEVAENESLHYSIFYNNAIYLAVHMLFSIVFFKNSTPLTNYVISIIMSAGFVAGISNTK